MARDEPQNVRVKLSSKHNLQSKDQNMFSSINILELEQFNFFPSDR